MKKFKQISALIISLLIIFASMPFAAACETVPVIMVSGFGATTLAQNGEAVFPPSLGKIADAVGINENLTAEKIISELKIWMQDEGYVQALSAIVERIIEPIRVNPDGSSAYDVKPIVSGAENTSYNAFIKNGMEDYIPYTGSEFLDMKSIAQRIGGDNVFNFTYDWRTDYNLVAEEFKDYIDDVLELTGAKKVSIYSISQGCLVVGQYLFKYSSLKQTDNIVFDTPVLGGTSFASDLFATGGVKLNMPVILKLLSDILHTEIDLTGLSDILETDFVSGAVDIGKSILLPPMQGCIAFWQLVPTEKFDDCRKAILDEEANAKVIEATLDFQNNGFMSAITETFEKATENGSEISIKACTGYTLVTPSNVYSDSIVDVKYSTGAVCAPYGESFPESYKQAVENGKNSISPDRTIDLSAGYWPHRTWVINGLMHGQVEWCEKSLGLVEELLFTHNIKDAYSSYEYPQFMESHAPTSDIAVSFVNTNSSFLLLEADRNNYTLEIKNVSLKNRFIINKIQSDAVSVDFDFGKILLPGETLYVNVCSKDVCCGKLEITYSNAKNIFESKTKSFGISVIDSYSGVTADDDLPQNTKIPVIFREIYHFWKNIFAEIIEIFK